MPQLRRRSSLPEKALLRRAAAQERRRNDLQGHLAVETGIEGLVSHAHAAVPKFDVFPLVVLKKLVMLEGIQSAHSHKRLLARQRKGNCGEAVLPGSPRLASIDSWHRSVISLPLK